MKQTQEQSKEGQKQSPSSRSLTDQDKLTLMSYCPNSWSGDTGFINWAYMVYNMGAASGQPANPPVVSGLNPSTVQSNKDNNVTVSGTGFDPATVVGVLNGTTNITPNATPPPSPTMYVILVTSAMTPTSGSVTIAAKNGDGQISAAATLSVT